MSARSSCDMAASKSVLRCRVPFRIPAGLPLLPFTKSLPTFFAPAFWPAFRGAGGAASSGRFVTSCPFSVLVSWSSPVCAGWLVGGRDVTTERKLQGEGRQYSSLPVAPAWRAPTPRTRTRSDVASVRDRASTPRPPLPLAIAAAHVRDILRRHQPQATRIRRPPVPDDRAKKWLGNGPVFPDRPGRASQDESADRPAVAWSGDRIPSMRTKKSMVAEVLSRYHLQPFWRRVFGVGRSTR